MFYHSFYWWFRLVNLANEPERIECGEVGPDINQAVCVSRPWPQPVTITSQVFPLSRRYLSHFWRIHKTFWWVCDNIYIAEEILTRLIVWLVEESWNNPSTTLRFKQSKTSEHQRFKAFHERKSGLNYKCSKGRVARENVCRKLKYQPSIIWCNIAKTVINFWREQRPCCWRMQETGPGGQARELGLPWAPAGVGCNLMVFAMTSHQWSGREHIITPEPEPETNGLWSVTPAEKHST